VSSSTPNQDASGLLKDEARLAVNFARLRQGNFGLNRAEGSTCRITTTHLAAGVGGLGDTPCRRFQHVGSLHVAGILGLEPLHQFCDDSLVDICRFGFRLPVSIRAVDGRIWTRALHHRRGRRYRDAAVRTSGRMSPGGYCWPR
jgi:hypothetical protein